VYLLEAQIGVFVILVLRVHVSVQEDDPSKLQAALLALVRQFSMLLKLVSVQISLTGVGDVTKTAFKL